VRVESEVLGEEIAIEIYNNKLYIEAGEITLGTDFNNVKELVEKVTEAFGLVLPQLDTKELLDNLTTTKPEIDFTGLTFEMADDTFALRYVKEDVEVEFALHTGANVEIAEPAEYEEITEVLKKVEELKSYIEKGIFEFSFEASYNEWMFVGTLKYNNGVLELRTEALGEAVTLRLENRTIYFSYGNMKVKFAQPDSSTSDFNLIETLKKITGDDFPVELQFGTFEDVIAMIIDYDFADYLENIIVSLDGNTNNIKLNVEKLVENAITNKLLLNAQITFENDKLNSININVCDILKAKLDVDNVVEGTIVPFDATQYEDYSDDFVAGLLDSLKVEENVYAFESDIAIRYSNNTFAGEITAMLTYDENAETILGHFTPAIQIHTTALGFNSYIYVIDQTAYIDIQGLQISADLSETTLNEVLNFVEEELDMSVDLSSTLGTSSDAFRMIIPAIDKIYGSWVTLLEESVAYNGLQIKIDDSLWYGVASRFEDMVMQVFVDVEDNVVLPYEIIFGADVYDPNTTVYDSYDNYLMDCETEVTSGHNFAVYLKDVLVGTRINNLDTTFVQNANREIVGLASNYGTSALEDYNSYKVVLSMAKAVLALANDTRYQFSLNGSLVSSENARTTLGGNINVELGDLAAGEANESGFELFNGKYLKVLGALDLTANAGTAQSAEHMFEVFYESKDSSAIYVTYTHGGFIGSGNTIKQKIANASETLKAKVSNSSLSEIVAMVLKFAGIDLGDSMEEKLGLSECTTDFRYLRSLLGLKDKERATPEISQADKIISSVEDVAQIVKNINLSQTTIGENLNRTTLSISVDLAKDGNIATLSLVFNDELVGGKVETKLRQIVVSNLIFAGNTVNATINIEDFSAANFDYNKSASHIDFSDISSFMDCAVNTINTKNWAFKGSTTVSLGDGLYTIYVGFDIYAALDENNELYLYIELDVEYKDDVTGSAQINPDYTSYILLGGSYDRRTSVLEYKNGYLTIVQYTYGIKATAFTSNSSKYDQVRGYGHGDNWIYAKDQIGSNMMKIMAQALGLSRTVYKIIEFAVSKVEATPTIEQALLGFSKSGNIYKLSINAENLTGMSGVENMTLNIGTSAPYNVKIDGVDTGAHRFIDSISTELKIGSVVSVPLNLNSVSGTSYKTNGGKVLYTNDYYRRVYAEQIKTLKFVTNCSQYVAPIVKPACEEIAIPTLSDYVVDNGTTHKTYSFAGWWTTSDFANGTEYTSNLMPTGDTTLYAKWDVDTLYYRTVTFVTNSKYSISSVYDIEGRSFALPTMETYVVDDGVTKTTRTFAGWYADSDLTQPVTSGIVGANNMSLYAKWNDAVEYYRTINFVTNTDSSVESITKLVGEAYTLPTLKQKQETEGYVTTFYAFEGWYYDSEFTNKVTEAVMPAQDTTLYAHWVVERVERSYQISLYDNGTVVDTLRAVSGDEFDLSALNKVSSTTKFYLDANYTTELTNYVMPEKDLNIYIRNKYNVTYNYYVIENNSLITRNTVQTLYQGESFSYPTTAGTAFGYIDYRDSSNKLSYRLYYTYAAYKNGNSNALAAMPNYNYELTVTYTTTRKEYYTISYDLRWYIVFGTTAGCDFKTAPTPMASEQFLEGTTINLSQSKYQPTCVAYTTAIHIGGGSKFKATSWGTSAWSNYTHGGSGFTSYTVTGNQTLYACWERQ
ncbi:MAG: InlB B-repeat-containing protein, partial [Clostridia bacterium]|nr:InlB B-repeat-containing protein [Clostridia bacterium]